MPPAVTRECPPARDAVRGTGHPRRRGSPRITASPAWWDWASGLGAAQKWPRRPAAVRSPGRRPSRPTTRRYTPTPHHTSVRYRPRGSCWGPSPPVERQWARAERQSPASPGSARPRESPTPGAPWWRPRRTPRRAEATTASRAWSPSPPRRRHAAPAGRESLHQCTAASDGGTPAEARGRERPGSRPPTPVPSRRTRGVIFTPNTPNVNKEERNTPVYYFTNLGRGCP